MTAVATPLAVVNIAEQRASTFIRRGQRAWTEIKKTAEEQRTLWLEVGVALMYGKQKENRDGLKFSEWVQQAFPGLVQAHASDAIWWAEFSHTVLEIPAGLTHPQSIRRWFNEQQSLIGSQDPVLAAAAAPITRVVLNAPVGKRIAKLHHRSQSNDEGSPLAASAIKGYAKQHGITEDELIGAAKESAPDEFYRFSPPVQKQLDSFRSSLSVSIADMRASGIPDEAIRAIYINLANTL